MNDIIFNSEEELYKRLLPALRTRKHKLNKVGYSYIKEENIWECLINLIWSNKTGIELCDMVDDILHVEDTIINNYYHKTNKNPIVETDSNFELPKLK